MHRVEYSKSGDRARVIIDLDGASLDSDANAIGSQWQTLKNVLTGTTGVLQKRGAIVNAGANSTDINDASGKLAFYDGQLWSGNTFRPYVGVCLDGSTIEMYAQNAGSSRASIVSSAAYGLPVSKSPSVAGWIVLAGREAANSTYPNRAAKVFLFGGSATSSGHTSGSVTVAAGSASVTGSGTSWTSSMEGMSFIVDTDTYAAAPYQVRKVLSSTSLILDRPYAGSATGAGLAHTMAMAVTYAVAAASPFGTANSDARFKLAASCWGRLVVASTREPGDAAAVSDSTQEFKSRIRWSGVVDSDDGAGGATGMFAWDANGHVDLAAKYGEVLALVPARDSVLAFQESGLTVIHGAPVFDGAGSIDISETHPGVAINGGFAFESTPEGVFFFDKNVGPCVYDGTRVVRLGDKRVTRTMLPYGITAVGYYDGKVLFSGTTTAGIFVFDTATGQWSLQIPPAVVSCLIAGRVENDEDVVGLGAGVQVVNLANMFDAPGVSAADWDSTAFVVDVKTGKIGDPVAQLRPERAYVSYRLTDLSTTNPYVTATVTAGLPDTSDSQHAHSSAATELVETTDVETKILELNLARDPMVQLRMLQSNAAGKLELYSVIVECCVEGEGPSS